LIFVVLGSQKFQFNRLLKEIDRLVEEGKLTEELFAQIGNSDYRPKNYKYGNFLDRDDFVSIMKECDKVITHGGTGTIIEAVRRGKKVIAVPRLREFGEHIDDHQLQIVAQLKEMGLIEGASTIKELEELIKNIGEKEFKPYVSNRDSLLESIDEFIEQI
jgi:UDP-N-acetylglucosamine transferase subunit ALG13